MSLAQAVFSFQDWSQEKSNVSVEMDVPADGTAFVTQEALIDAMAVAMKALSLCNLNYYGSRYVQNDQLGEPASEYAQRELGLRLFWRETSGDDPAKGNVTIPGPDLSICATNNSDEVDLSITEVAALVAALEAAWNGTLAVNREIYRARIVGRRS
jgi:hypothetical protein